MSIVVLNAASSLNCYAPRARPAKRSLARAAITKLNEYFLVSLLFLRAVKGRLPRLGEVPPAVHALPQVAPAVTCSSFNNGLPGAKIESIRCRP